jgi:hypothetical protein
MTTNEKLKLIHHYGRTHSFETIPDRIGMILFSRSNNFHGFGKDRDDAIDELYDSLEFNMEKTVDEELHR